MVGRYPIAVIFIDLPPDQVDVNVHPTKAEIRFLEPQKVFSLVQRAVRASLLGQVAPPQVSLQQEWRRESSEHSFDWQFAEQDNFEQRILPLSGHKMGSEEDVLGLLVRSAEHTW
jgi:DNA mismatch repair protein MutL